MTLIIYLANLQSNNNQQMPLVGNKKTAIGAGKILYFYPYVYGGFEITKQSY